MKKLNLHDWLLRRAFSPRLAGGAGSQPGVGAAISRRAFLLSSGSLGVAAVAAGRDRATPQFAREGRALVVFFEDRVWKIDPAAFAPGARVRMADREDGSFIAELQNARLPGTDFDASLRIVWTRSGAAWQITVEIPGQRFRAAAPFGPWLRGEAQLAGRIATRRIGYGGGAFTFNSTGATLEMKPALGFTFAEGNGGVRFSGPFEAAGSSLRLDLDIPAPESLRAVMRRSDAAATRFVLHEPVALPEPVAIGRTTLDETVGCCIEGPPSISGELFEGSGGDEGVILLEGPMRVHAAGRVTDPAQPREIRLERAALSMAVGAAPPRSALAGRVSRAAQSIETSGCQFTIVGDDEEPLYLQSDHGRTGTLRVRARLRGAWIPVPGAVGAVVSVPDLPVDVVACGECGEPAAGSGLIVLNTNPFAVVPLTGGRLNLRRGVDLLNLSFGFEGFELRVRDGSAWLMRLPPTRKGDRWPDATVTVRFPPQHVAEWSCSHSDPSRCEPDGRLPDVSPARLSAPSRLVFALNSDAANPQWARQPLTVEHLTDWWDLALRVHDRAMSDDASAEDQLRLARIDADTTLESFRDSLAWQMRPPGADRTALTLVSRLVLSPSGGPGRWMTPRRPVDRAEAPLWHARLSDSGRRSVRAIWSSYLQEGQLEVLKATPEDARLLALQPPQHWEIVGQSSIYGIPALRRIGDDNRQGGPDRPAQPRSRVVRWNAPMLYRAFEPSSYPEGDVGNALPTPFDDADIILTGIGGSYRADWLGEPPNVVPWPAHGPSPTGFNLEKLHYRSHLGRDIRVEAVDKGCMLPLGIRCSHVTLVERRFVTHPSSPYPTAYLFRRNFIVFGKPDKPFPAVHQPFEGRDFPVGRVRMLTERTPDLAYSVDAPPEPAPGNTAVVRPDGGIRLPGHAGYKVFWPRAAARRTGDTGDVEFSWAIDEDATPVSCHLLFVENRVLTDAAAVEGIVEYYRSLADTDERLCTATLGGMRRQYAPAAADGVTSFDTESWVLSARGRLVLEPGGGDAQAATEHFRMDARMEGADQPPFYPVVDQARVSVQSIDRLLGRPQGLIRVGFTPEYVRHGFDAAANPSEIYLSVLGPDIVLDVTNQGNAAGGIAKPNALIVALSRKTGPVGGKRLPAATAATRLVQDRAAAVGRTAVGVEGDYDFSAALAGRFEPSEFLGGLGNAKLLGLIPLDVVLKATAIEGAPRLLEEVAYGPAAAGLEKVRALFRSGALTNAVGRLKQEVTGAVPHPLQPADVYPQLWRRLLALEAALAGVQARIGDASPVEFPALLTPVIGDAKALLSEMERTIGDPMPAFVRDLANELARTWADLRGVLRGELDGLVRQVAQEFRARLLDWCSKLGSIAPELFGTEEAESPGEAREAACEELLRAPDDALRRAGRALFAEQFTRPVLRLLVWLGRTTAQVNAEIAIPRAELEGQVQAALADAAAPFRSRFKEVTPEAAIDAIARSITEGLMEEVAAIIANHPTAKERLDAVRSYVLTVEQRAFIAAAVIDGAGLLPVREGVDTGPIAAEIARAMPRRVARAVERSVGREITRVQTLLDSAADAVRDEGTARVIEGIGLLLEAMIAARALSEASRAMTEWCAEDGRGLRPALNAVRTATIGLVTPVVALRGSMGALNRAAGQLAPATRIPDDLRALQEAAIARVREAIAQIDTAVAQISLTLREVEAVTVGEICARPGTLVRAVRRFTNSRIDALARLQDVADRLAALEAIRTAPPAQRELLELVARLLTEVSGIARIGNADVWRSAEQDLLALAGALPAESAGAAQAIRDRTEAIRNRAAAARAKLETASAAALSQSAPEIRAFMLEAEKELVAAVAQTIALTEDASGRLAATAVDLLRAAATPAAALHASVYAQVQPLVGRLELQPFRDVIHPKVLDPLRAGRDAMSAEQTLLEQIRDSGSLRAAHELRERWGGRPPAIGGLVRAVAELLEALVSGNLGAVLNFEALRQAARLLETQLRDALRQLVPSAVSLSYDWQTSVGAFPAGDRNAIFAMRQSSAEDLRLSARISVDLAGTREAVVTGTLQAFRVKLLGSLFDIATIWFAGASFESRNGSAPKFRAQVETVVPGELIKFLEPLQAWLSPEGSGFYVRPILHPPAIEAGYGFAADIIPLGPLQFVNVALDVSGRLPFTDGAALFRFSFASPERPFLITAPPYGGGGYVSLVASAGRIVEFRLSLVFGAVVPIKFGPLRAQGRVVAGIFIERGAHEHTLGALVEAVGEGNIACFSISVSFRVKLEQRKGDNKLQGSAVYSFKFKLGFVRFRFHVTVRYTARNDRGPAIDSRSARLLAAAPTVGGATGGEPETRCDAKHYVVTPHKLREWEDYSRYLALDLLDLHAAP